MPGARIVIDRRFCGFPEWAHGGYVGGLLARQIGPSADVRLRRPIPLAHPLDLEWTDAGVAVLRSDDTLFAEGYPGVVDISLPQMPTLDEVRSAARLYPADRHRIPGCFVCGPHRPDGLRVFPAPVWGRDVVAAMWTPRPELADPDGYLRPEFVWAALDCTEAWALIMGAVSGSGERAVTGQMASRIMAPLDWRDRYVLVGWTAGREGRKLYAEAAVCSPLGEVLAVSRTTWIVSDWGAQLDSSILEKPAGAMHPGEPDAPH